MPVLLTMLIHLNNPDALFSALLYLLWNHNPTHGTNCNHYGNDFAWFRDNLPAGITKKNITIEWVFGEKWNPKKTEE